MVPRADGGSVYILADNAAGAVYALTGYTGTSRRFALAVTGADVYFAVGDATLVGTDVVAAGASGALRGYHVANGVVGFEINLSGYARIAFRAFGGGTALVHFTEIN